MEKLYLLPILTLIAFVLIYSCSTEEEDTTPPPSVIATPEPEPPAPTQYTLTVSAGEGGTVSTEGGTYDEGTNINISAQVIQGYVFTGWNDGSTTNPKSITLNQDTSLRASFISIQDYFNSNFNSSTIPEINAPNNTTDNYIKWFRPFYDYNSLIAREQYSMVNIYDNGDVGLNGPPTDENHGHEQMFTQFLDINNNEIPDLVISAHDIHTEETGEIYVVIDNELTYRFNSEQIATRKILSGDIDNNGSDDIVLIGTGIDKEPYTGTKTKIIYFTPNDYELVSLDNEESYFHTGAIGDVNNDNNLDIIVINNQDRVSDGNTYLYLGNGDKTFSKVYQGNAWTSENDTNAFGIRYNMDFHDFNNDNNLDIIIGGHEWADDWGRPFRNTIYYGSGDGNFDYSNGVLLPEIDYWGITNDFKMLDVDSDGISEIIINRTTGHEDYNVVENDRGYDGVKIQILKKVDGEYINHQIIDGPSGWFDLPPTWGEWIPFIEMFDVNGDGILDIVPDSEGISNPNYDPLKRYWGMYYRGDSSGRFELDFFNPNQPN
jgi:uncharacterized repeat protein (TIGR02543 family)